jgi:hypothetical protein
MKRAYNDVFFAASIWEKRQAGLTYENFMQFSINLFSQLFSVLIQAWEQDEDKLKYPTL